MIVSPLQQVPTTEAHLLMRLSSYNHIAPSLFNMGCYKSLKISCDNFQVK